MCPTSKGSKSVEHKSAADRTSAIIPVLMCGGTGTRLWPLSRESFPKQFLPIHGQLTLFQQTASRVSDTSEFAPPIVVANDEHRFIVTEQIRAIGLSMSTLLVEPDGRNTAPAAAVAALHALELDANATLLIMPSDHVISDHGALLQAVRAGLPAARSGHIVLFGIEPTSPAVGYGYIQRGPRIRDGEGGDQVCGDGEVFEVAAFVEKPDH